jgi:hypothetical protein
MKTIIKILIAIAVVNAAARVGMAAASYYQLKDEAQEAVTFGAQASPGQIQNVILQKAVEFNVPLQPGDVEVTREGLHTTVTASYTQPVEVFPNYTYPINFHFSVDALSMAGLNTEPGQHPLIR